MGSDLAGVCFENPKSGEPVGQRSAVGCPVHVEVHSLMTHTGQVTSLEWQKRNWSHQISCRTVGNRKAETQMSSGILGSVK